MKTTQILLAACGLCVASALGLSSARGQMMQNVVQDGNFSASASTFNKYPGYVNSPTQIAAWPEYHGGNTFGINGTTDTATVFGPADQSTVKDYVFLQNPGGGGQPSGAATGVGVYQTITLQPSTTYTLSYAIASRNNGAAAQGTLSIYDGVVTANSMDSNQPPALGSTALFLSDTELGSQAAFTTITDIFTTPATLSAAGQTISLVNTTPGNPDDTIDYTNIVLTPIPEPSSFVSLLALGAGALFLVRRNRSKA